MHLFWGNLTPFVFKRKEAWISSIFAPCNLAGLKCPLYCKGCFQPSEPVGPLEPYETAIFQAERVEYQQLQVVRLKNVFMTFYFNFVS